MDHHRNITILVDGRSHEAFFTVADDHLRVHTDAGERRVPLRRFEPEELAQIVAIDLLRTQRAGDARAAHME